MLLKIAKKGRIITMRSQQVNFCNHCMANFLCKGDVQIGFHSMGSSLTNEKDHHYFLNSADVCW